MRLYRRLRRLITGRYIWQDVDDGSEEMGREDWQTRWAIDGVHSWRWRWVRSSPLRRSCGCIRSPFSGRKTVFCVDHAGL